MESRRRQSNKRSTRKQVRRLAKRGGSKRRGVAKRGGVTKRGGGCGIYKGGAMNNPVPGPAPVPVPIGSRFRNACIALNDRIGDDQDLRRVVKRYLKTLYGTSETWKALRRPPPAGIHDADFDGLPEDVKGLVQDLLDIVLEIYETGNEATQTLIFIHLTNYNLYYLTREQVDEGENDESNWSSNYESSNNEDEDEEEEQNDPSMGSPRSQGSRGSHSSNVVGTP